MQCRETPARHEGDDGLLPGAVRDDVEIERQAWVSVGGQRHATDHGERRTFGAQERADLVQLATEVHRLILPRTDATSARCQAGDGEHVALAQAWPTILAATNCSIG